MVLSEKEKKTGRIAAIFSFGQIADITRINPLSF